MERPWLGLVTFLPESGRLQTNDLGEERISVRFVSAERTWKTVYLTFFLEGKVCLALEDSKKSLGCHHVFLIKFSYGPGTRKPFAWKVMLSVLSLLIMHDFLLSSIALWSSFEFVCKHYLSLSNTKSDTFFYWPS